MNKTSLRKLGTCHPDMIRLATEVDKEFPIQCICGERDEVEQNRAYNAGTSKKKYPDSKHNRRPSLAGDFVPDPDKNPATLDWGDMDAFAMMNEVFQRVADRLGIKIRQGKTWGDHPHQELI